MEFLTEYFTIAFLTSEAFLKPALITLVSLDVFLFVLERYFDHEVEVIFNRNIYD